MQGYCTDIGESVPCWDIEGRELASVLRFPNDGQYYRVIALILVNTCIVPCWDIEGRELPSILRYPNEGQYSPISVQ